MLKPYRSQRNQRESPLLRLPAELRNLIYQLTFEGSPIKSLDKVAVSLYPNIKFDRASTGIKFDRPCTRHHVLLTCHQIYKEAESLFYKHSIFAFNTHRHTILYFFEDRTLIQLQAITSLKFTMRHTTIAVQWEMYTEYGRYDLIYYYLKYMTGLKRVHQVMTYDESPLPGMERWIEWWKVECHRKSFAKELHTLNPKVEFIFEAVGEALELL